MDIPAGWPEPVLEGNPGCRILAFVPEFQQAPRSATLSSVLGAVEIVEYDLRWAEEFASECERITAVLGPEVGVEHIGSTAVPGLSAKPVVDIMVGVASGLDLASTDEAFEGLGYKHHARGDLEGRRFFRRVDGEIRTHHLSVTKRGGSFWRDQLCFRDALLASPELARRYGELKRRLATAHRQDRLAYTEAKTDFVREVLDASGGGAESGLAAQR